MLKWFQKVLSLESSIIMSTKIITKQKSSNKRGFWLARNLFYDLICLFAVIMGLFFFHIFHFFPIFLRHNLFILIRLIRRILIYWKLRHIPSYNGSKFINYSANGMTLLNFVTHSSDSFSYVSICNNYCRFSVWVMVESFLYRILYCPYSRTIKIFINVNAYYCIRTCYN